MKVTIQCEPGVNQVPWINWCRLVVGPLIMAIGVLQLTPVSLAFPGKGIQVTGVQVVTKCHKLFSPFPSNLQHPVQAKLREAVLTMVL